MYYTSLPIVLTLVIGFVVSVELGVPRAFPPILAPTLTSPSPPFTLCRLCLNRIHVDRTVGANSFRSTGIITDGSFYSYDTSSKCQIVFSVVCVSYKSHFLQASCRSCRRIRQAVWASETKDEWAANSLSAISVCFVCPLRNRLLAPMLIVNVDFIKYLQIWREKKGIHKKKVCNHILATITNTKSERKIKVELTA